MNVVIQCVLEAVIIVFLALCFSKGVTRTHSARNLCPLQALNSISEGNGCNKALRTLKAYIDYLDKPENQGCTSGCACTMSFNYWSSHSYSTKYDIYRTNLTAAYKTTSSSWIFDEMCQNNNNRRRILYINCNLKDCNENIFHDICIPGTDCADPYKTCYPNNGNNLGICVCKDKYIGMGHRCLIGNLSLGQGCERDEQCSSLTNSQCQSGKCVCKAGYKSFHSSECIPKRVFVGGSCDLDEQCTGSSNSGLCRESRCNCKDGYISFNHTCYAGNSTLNQTCEIHEQCSTVLNSICGNRTCVCRDGYTAVNSTYCQQEENIEYIQRNYQLQKSSDDLGMTLGAILGGFLLGVFLTALAVYVLYRRYASDMRKREEPGVAFAGDAVYGTNSATEVIQSQILVNTGKHVQRKVVNVQPYAPSIEAPTYSNVEEAGKARMDNEDVYNHLNEKEEKNENNDHYDITPGTSRVVVTESDYSHLNAGRRNDRIILSQDDEYACTEKSISDNYFTLEKQ